MPIITSPESVAAENRNGFDMIFLAGGISDCPDWQKPVAERIIAAAPSMTVINPRRTAWKMDHKDPSSIVQIKWEHAHLKMSTNIMFWFPEETLCPITLFELGKYLMQPVNLFIGTHPNYQRRLDVEVQVGLELTNHVIHDNLDDVVDEFIGSYLDFKMSSY